MLTELRYLDGPKIVDILRERIIIEVPFLFKEIKRSFPKLYIKVYHTDYKYVMEIEYNKVKIELPDNYNNFYIIINGKEATKKIVEGTTQLIETIVRTIKIEINV